MAADHTALAGRVAPFDYDGQAPAGVLQPARQVVEFELQRLELRLVVPSCPVRRRNPRPRPRP